jgi:hypothetical protein
VIFFPLLVSLGQGGWEKLELTLVADPTAAASTFRAQLMLAVAGVGCRHS